jgi:hypothetical protein
MKIKLKVNQYRRSFADFNRFYAKFKHKKVSDVVIEYAASCHIPIIILYKFLEEIAPEVDCKKEIADYLKFYDMEIE